jgi:predicted TIM-barrel fold metal-dependent hydrolase
MMIIDFHTHVLPPRIKQDRGPYVDRDPAFAAIYSSEKARIATAEDLIDAMERDGIAFSVIVNYSWSTHELCVETNDYILASAARYPGLLAGFCAVASFEGEASLAEIERCARGGARGVGELRPDLLSPDFADKEAMDPFAGALQRHGLVLMVHASEPVGHAYPGKGSATPDRLYPFIECFPELPVVCAHWGGGLPFYALMPEVRRALENVYFDTAASPFLYRPEIYPIVSGLVGGDRVLFGSDYPVMPASRLLKEIEASGLDAATRQEILSGNARRLLGI